MDGASLCARENDVQKQGNANIFKVGMTRNICRVIVSKSNNRLTVRAMISLIEYWPGYGLWVDCRHEAESILTGCGPTQSPVQWVPG
jgi:hypothetical protein